ncbi:MAG: hydrogenase formation protein HypD [Fimbriimonadales bacterium]|nr:hydrogenase formation protein HypD [Fimbriimonadales bacterium]
MIDLAGLRDPDRVRSLAAEIGRVATRPWTLMEVCGGQTHAIARYGLEELLPEGLELVHGPGCPVCVTPAGTIDVAARISRLPGVCLATFGDMVRVPGSEGDLFQARAAGGDVRVVASPLDAVAMARQDRSTTFVFLGVGFETTAPAVALAVLQAEALGLKNFAVLAALVRVPPALEAILEGPGNRVRAFLAAGHVCTVMGTAEYAPLVARHRVPIVATGFEPTEILAGVLAAVRQLEAGEARVENAYTRAVAERGNGHAREAVRRVFEVGDRQWRGIGRVPGGGLRLRPEYAPFDAERRFALSIGHGEDAGECIAGLILRGVRKPPECPAFGTRCTPERPLGAPMVSTEGACAAYHRYRRTGS